MKKSVFLLSLLMLCSWPTVAVVSVPGGCENGHVLWYGRPAENWMTSALPIGNGRLGAMIFGGTEEEHMQFNDKTLWTGSTEERGAYQNFGDIFIRFEKQGNAADYVRYLDIGDATAGVAYSAAGVEYKREYFASFPDDVIVMRFTADKQKKIGFEIDVADAHGQKSEARGNVITTEGKLTLLSYRASVTVIHEGGTLTRKDGCIAVRNADAATLFLVAGTDYDPAESGYLTKKNWRAELENRRLNAMKKGYDQIRTSHVEDYAALYGRVSLELGGEKPAVPTDELLSGYTAGKYGPAAEALFFRYGRYLAIASSREGLDLPSNLQGLWNDSNDPPWGGDIHSNINVQMNYWPAEVANLAECHMPFINYIRNEALEHGSWRAMAGEMECRGWTLKTQNNIFGYSDFVWNRPANGWYCMHVWDRYLFGLDWDYLRRTAYPVMKSACEFWLDRLIVDDDGTLVAPNEWSPEHGPLESGAAYAQQIVADLFANTIRAGILAGADDGFTTLLEEKYGRLDKGLRIGNWGQLREWKHTNDDPNDRHRHVSHLMALYPGRAISPISDPAIAGAARRSLDARGDGGTGWSRVWKIGFWARLLDGDRAHRLLKSSLALTDDTGMDYMDRGGVYENMLDSHPPFQIDGNLGATACMSELLLQSHAGELHLLPALPGAWASGRVAGLRARGAIEVDMRWESGRLAGAVVRSDKGAPCRIRTDVPVSVAGAEAVSETDGKGYHITTFETSPGGVYELTAK